MHPLINPEEFFTPSEKAKRRWTRTRKTKKKLGEGEEAVTLYGLFSTYNYEGDKRGFLIAILLELLGVAAIIWAAGSFNPYIFCGFIAGIGLDITFAILSHIKAGTICQLRNEETINLYYAKRKRETALSNSNNNISDGGDVATGFEEIADKKNQLIMIWSSIHILFKLCIIGVAFIKIFVFQQLQNSISTLTFGIVILYLWIAYLQIANTGFFFAEWFFRRTVKKEKTEFNIKLATKKDSLKLLNPKESNLLKDWTTQHEDILGNIVLKTEDPSHKNYLSNKDGALKYWIWGILQDDDLLTIANNQDSMEATEFAATMGIEIQLKLINTQSTNENILNKLGKITAK